MKLYAGIDLHSTNSYVALLNEDGELKYKKRLPNDLQIILHELSSFNDIESVVVESTYNWYWLVDGLQHSGYRVRLANTNAVKQYDGLKHTNDKTDACWLAELNRLKILPEGYIYPKEERSTRDLLRKRMQLVQQQTLNLLSIQTIIERNSSKRISGNKIKVLTEEELKIYLPLDNVRLAAASNLAILNCLQYQIDIVEKAILSQVKGNSNYIRLQSVNGIGKILALTILLETGDIQRFKQVGNYSSYCRCVDSEKISNGKKKGVNNRKNGNKYLGWAYVEAANFAIRHNEIIKRYYQKKSSKKNRTVAIKTIAHKLARACFYIIRDGVDFDVNLAFKK